MVKDSHANERFEYQEKILQKERHVEELKSENHHVQSQLSHLKNEFSRGFRQLQELNGENKVKDDYQALAEQEELQMTQRKIQLMLENEAQEFNRVYKNEISKIDAQQEKLRKEKNELPWD